MIEHWTKFEGSPISSLRRQIRVALGTTKEFHLNFPAYDALGEPEAVEMFFDEILKRIGFRKCDPAMPNTFHLIKCTRPQFHQISAAAFCNRFGIKAHRRVLFEQSYVNPEGILVLDLKKAVVAEPR